MAVDREVERAVPPLAAAHVVSDDAERLAAHSLDSDFLRTLIEESNRTFFLIDPTTRQLVYISPAFERIWGLPRSVFYDDGNRWYASIHPEDHDRCRAEAADRLARPEISHPSFDYRIFRPDGQMRWVRGNVFQCRHLKTDETLLCGIAEDITTIKLHEQTRDQAQALLEETVRLRTAELTAANEALQREIDRSIEIEQELRRKQAFLEKTLHFQEWERKLVTFEIHDCTIQNVVAARMHVDAVVAGNLTRAQQKKLASSSELLRTAVDESRRVINGMRPQTLDVLGLRAAVDELLAQYECDGLRVNLHYDLEGRRMSPMIETTVYRLIQEALTNVHRHAGADTAEVEVRRDQGHILLRISDAGRGFDPQSVDPEKYGLRGLHERAAAVGGSVCIDAAPNRGSVINARLPLLDPLEAANMERDSAAAALLLSRARLEQIIDKASAVIFVKDHLGRYELANREHERLFSLEPGAILGKNDYDILPKEAADAVIENDRRAVDMEHGLTIEETIPVDGVLHEYVTVKFAIPGEPGQPPSVCGIATDITEQKRQLRDLQEARNRFQAFMDHSPMLAWIKDAEGKYVFMNRRMLEIFNLTTDGVYGKTDMDIFPQQWAQPAHEHDMEVLANGGTHRYREYCPIGDGEPIAWDACKFRLQGIDGGYLIGGVALDVSGATDPSCYGVPRA